MDKLFFTVVDTFWITPGRLFVSGNVTRCHSGYRTGDTLELRRPDGSILHAKSFLNHSCTDPKVLLANPSFEPPVSLYLEGLTKEDVPIGTEAWLITEHPPTEQKLSRHIKHIEEPDKRS